MFFTLKTWRGDDIVVPLVSFLLCGSLFAVSYVICYSKAPRLITYRQGLSNLQLLHKNLSIVFIFLPKLTFKVRGSLTPVFTVP